MKKKKKEPKTTNCIRSRNSIPSSELRWYTFCTDLLFPTAQRTRKGAVLFMEHTVCASWALCRTFYIPPHIVFTEYYFQLNFNTSILQMGKWSPRIVNLSKLKEARMSLPKPIAKFLLLNHTACQDQRTGLSVSTNRVCLPAFPSFPLLSLPPFLSFFVSISFTKYFKHTKKLENDISDIYFNILPYFLQILKTQS